jgi:hypothetical protein
MIETSLEEAYLEVLLLNHVSVVHLRNSSVCGSVAKTLAHWSTVLLTTFAVSEESEYKNTQKNKK